MYKYYKDVVLELKELSRLDCSASKKALYEIKKFEEEIKEYEEDGLTSSECVTLLLQYV